MLHFNVAQHAINVWNKCFFFQKDSKHSLSTECTYKLGDSWQGSKQTKCEAFVYYFPASSAPVTCVSSPDQSAVTSTINELFNVTLPVRTSGWKIMKKLIWNS